MASSEILEQQFKNVSDELASVPRGHVKSKKILKFFSEPLGQQKNKLK